MSGFKPALTSRYGLFTDVSDLEKKFQQVIVFEQGTIFFVP